MSHKKMLSEVSHLINGISSYNTNIMLAALISLILVILFVLLLHLYAKWFLSLARQRRHSSSVTVSHVLHPSRFHNFHAFHFEDATPASNSPSKGLEASIIASIPLFVYKSNNITLEYCVICLSAFEEEEIGRELPKCGHGFHLECINMWLHSHSNCPICRASVVVEDDFKVETGDAMAEEESNIEIAIHEVGSVDSETIENAMENNHSSTSSTSSLENLLKKMSSRNTSEHKVFNVSEFEA